MRNNRPIAAQILQLSFDFSRADASLAATLQAGNPKASAAIANNSSPDLVHFGQLKNNADLASQQATQEVETIKKKLATAQGAERRTLQAALDVTKSRLELLQAGSAGLQELVDFVQVTGGRQTDLASSIDDLARTVPEMTSPTTVRAQPQSYEVASLAKPRDSGILGLSSDVSALGRKLRLLDDEIGRTDTLRRSSNDLRKPLLAYVNKRFPVGDNDYLQASDLRVLQQQKAELDALIAVAKTLAPAW